MTEKNSRRTNQGPQGAVPVSVDFWKKQDHQPHVQALIGHAPQATAEQGYDRASLKVDDAVRAMDARESTHTS
ncbi:hypothetical protein ABZ863_18710 [Saccharomonospora sp. NPDC046836]|uniref:hypothetical protein n=1 Tax=Saccharomonospora sp. NPDC046836 TaxID=3156921 RepID=UPI0033F54420